MFRQEYTCQLIQDYKAQSYNIKEKALGFIDGKKNRIVQIPQCQICNPIVQKQVESLYKDESWIKLAKKYKIDIVPEWFKDSLNK